MKDKTKLIEMGRPHGRPHHPVNPPVERASTILFPTYNDFVEGAKSITYGRLGTSTHRALEEAVTALEGGYETRLASSGLQACVASILAFVETGDHVLIADSVYDPTRKFCTMFLARFGVEAQFYDPTISGDELSALMTKRTKVVFMETPGSLTFEVQDIPAFAAVTQEHGATLVVDNTWGAGYFLKPVALGADVSVQAATKYLSGHSDCLVGTITSADEKTARKIYLAILQLGANVSADDAYLTLRGLRTLSARLRVHEEQALALAKWFDKRREVARVLHPALKSCPGHAIWKRDFTGASGLFGVVLQPTPEQALRAFFDAFKLIGMGFSWGGYESLCIPADPAKNRSATAWDEPGPTIRFHAGLEDIEDLKVDLNRAFHAMNAAMD
ncbi:MAG: cystathionine beta-lyase [Pseudomonadota bacterium]